MEKGSVASPAMSSSYLVLLLLTIGVVRILYIVYQRSKPLNPKSPQPLRTLIVFGSEMQQLLNVLQKERLKPRFYIAAATDKMSLKRARVYEDSLVDKAGVDAVGRAEFMQIYRSREVGQLYITSIGTTMIAMAHAFWLMIKIRPKVILCNGPGTCVPLCVIAFFFKVLGISWSSVFYVESIARVRRLSLSGLLLYKLRIVDLLFVQWPQLKEKYPRAHYVGCLM